MQIHKSNPLVFELRQIMPRHGRYNAWVQIGGRRLDPLYETVDTRLSMSHIESQENAVSVL